jgi:hypothetical protein
MHIFCRHDWTCNKYSNTLFSLYLNTKLFNHILKFVDFISGSLIIAIYFMSQQNIAT